MRQPWWVAVWMLTPCCHRLPVRQRVACLFWYIDPTASSHLPLSAHVVRACRGTRVWFHLLSLTSPHAHTSFAACLSLSPVLPQLQLHKLQERRITNHIQHSSSRTQIRILTIHNNRNHHTAKTHVPPTYPTPSARNHRLNVTHRSSQTPSSTMW